jgi:transcriptional regulator with XRE-family HTH domain
MTGQQLKELRLKHGLTQEELAVKLGTAQTRVSEWESGRIKMNNITSKALEFLFKDLEKKQG